MNNVIILWSGAAAAALLLGIVRLTTWLLDRQTRANLAFAGMAFSLAGVAITELAMMTSQTPEEWGRFVRWCHAPMFVHVVGILLFVRLFLGAGRLWLMWTVIALRGVILISNFAAEPNFNFRSVDAIKHIDLLGERITVLQAGVTSAWQPLATLSVILMCLFVLDASVTHWKRKDADAKHKALVVGGSISLFVILSSLATQLVIWQVVEMPMLITPPFLILLVSMAIELSRDTLRAGRLANNLRESEHQLELAANAAQFGLWTWDARRARIWTTQRARNLFGFANGDDITLENVRARIHREDFSQIKELLKAAMHSREDYRLEFRVCPPDSTPRWLASQGEVECDDQGNIKLIRGVLRDVSDQKNSQHEAEELRREVAHAGRVTMLGQLASALAHELSQPLGAILRNTEAAEILLAAPSPDLVELRAIVADIHGDNRRAGDIIERLHELLRRRQIQFQPISVESLVKDTGTLVRADAAARHVRLEYKTEEALPMIAGDRVHLSQVLINLILNGMDAITESNGAHRQVAVTARSFDKTTVEIAVFDSGPGIAADALSRIFEPFFTTKTGGMGMGLSVSRTIAEAHGGQLLAENAIAGGAVFRLMLPVVPSISTESAS